MAKNPALPATGDTLDALIHKNIDTINQIEQASHDNRSRADIVADKIASFCGSMAFVWVHVVWFGGWLLLNVFPGIPKAVRFDPPPFPNLTLVVSLEAIFLSTFILISQNRQQRGADRRNHLDLQINLLAEQESSQMLTMMRQMMDHFGIVEPGGSRSAALGEDTDPIRLMSDLEENLAADPAHPDSPSPKTDSPT